MRMSLLLQTIATSVLVVAVLLLPYRSAFAWDATTLSYDSVSFSVSSQLSASRDLAFSADGTRMYVAGMTTDRTFQYDLGTPWDVSTAVYNGVNILHSAQEPSIRTLEFSSDGSKMYILGGNHNSVFQYDLSTPWDLSTATYNSDSFSFADEDSQAYGLAFNTDGTKMFTNGSTNKTLYQYSLGTAWDVTTASYDSVSYAYSGLSYGVDIEFSNDGSRMYLINAQLFDDLYQYSLSTPWDITTASSDGKMYDLNDEDTGMISVEFRKGSGVNMYGIGFTANAVYQYSLDDDIIPTVQSISSDTVDGTYIVGDTIDIDVEFSEPVTSTGEMTVTLETGDTDRACTFSVTASSTATCNYVVQANDVSSDLEATLTGTVADTSDNAMVSFTPSSALVSTSDLVIDGLAPELNTLSPADNSTDIAVSSAFSITFNQIVQAQTGNISLYTSDAVLVEQFDVTSDISGSGSTTITLTPSENLDPGTSYYVLIDATAFDDASGNSFSGIIDSTIWNFTTLEEEEADESEEGDEAEAGDDDGIADAVEDAAPNNGDANNDGTPDSEQSHVASFLNAETDEYVVVAVNEACSLSSVSSQAASDVASDNAFSYPFGLTGFTATCVTPGTTITVTQYYYTTSAIDFVLRKYINDEFSTITDAIIEPITIDGESLQRVSYSVTDGGPLDVDGEENAVIVDPVGLAQATETDSSGEDEDESTDEDESEAESEDDSTAVSTDESEDTSSDDDSVVPNTGLARESMTLYVLSVILGIALLLFASPYVREKATQQFKKQ